MEAKLTGGTIKVNARNATAVSHDLMNGSITIEQLEGKPFRVILYYALVPIEFLEKYWDNFAMFDKAIVSSNQKLTEDFMMKHRDELCWRNICRYQTLSEPFMISMQDYLDWEMVWQYQTLSEDFKFRYREVSDTWIMKYGKQVNATVRLGRVDNVVEEENDSFIKTVEEVKAKKKKKNKQFRDNPYKKNKKIDPYSYSDMY